MQITLLPTYTLINNLQRSQTYNKISCSSRKNLELLK